MARLTANYPCKKLNFFNHRYVWYFFRNTLITLLYRSRQDSQSNVRPGSAGRGGSHHGGQHNNGPPAGPVGFHRGAGRGASSGGMGQQRGGGRGNF